MKRILFGTTALSLALLGGAFLVQNTEFSANAAPVTLSVQEGNAELFLPTSYEQYLNLSAPSDIAFSEDYIAIADGKILYVYDGTTYFSYSHSENINKIDFFSSEYLYFLDAKNNLHQFNVTTKNIETATLSCIAFTLGNEMLYIANGNDGILTFTEYRLSPTENTWFHKVTEVATIGEKNNPQNGTVRMTYSQNVLHCAVNSIIYSYPSEFPRHFLDSNGDVENLTALCAEGDSFYYSVSGALIPAENGLYYADHAGNAVQLLQGNDFKDVCYYQNYLYAVQDASVLQYEITETGAIATGYKICASSSSVNRLGQGASTVRAGNLLVTGDTANNRIVIYDFRTKEYRSVEVNAPNLIATDGSLIAVSSGASITLIKNNTRSACNVGDEVVGLCCIYGKIYYVAKNGEFGNILPDLTTEQAQRGGNPLALTCDLYGNLYAVNSDRTITKFTEQNFCDKFSLGEEHPVTLENDFSAFQADFEGNLYYLSGGNKLFKNAEQIATVESTGAVYRSDTPALSSFALGFEDNGIYFLYDDFMLKTTALDFPTLDKIPCGDIYSQVFETPSELKLVDVAEGTVGIRTNLTALQSGQETSFPYGGYGRVKAQRGILLGTVNNYSLVALFGEKGGYTASLFQTVTPVDKAEFWQEQTGVRYAISAVSPMKFPCIDQALSLSPLVRTQKINLLATVKTGNQAEYEYAYIEYEGAQGTQKGYVPLSCLTEIAPLAAGESYRIGYLKENASGTVFTAEDGATVTVTERTQVYVWGEEPELFAKITVDGKTYVARVTAEQIEIAQSDALRISLIVILIVVAAIVVGLYVYLVPKRKK